MLAGILETVPPAVILFSVGMLGWMLLMLFQNEIAIRQIDASIKEWAQQFDSDENPHCSSEQVPVGAGGAHTSQRGRPSPQTRKHAGPPAQ